MYSFILLIVISIMALILVFGFIWAIRKNIKTSTIYRKQLASKLEKYRLSRALQLFGINSAEYLHKQQIVDIENHIRTCSTCKVTEQCDIHLCHDLPATEFGFCPNSRKLANIATKA